MSALTLAAARASLGDERHVARQRDRNLGTRSLVRAEVERLGSTVLPSEANFVMIDMGRDVKPVIASLRDRGVHVGRRFPAMPQHLRVTIGTPDEMKRFLREFAVVIRSDGYGPIGQPASRDSTSFMSSHTSFLAEGVRRRYAGW